MVYKLASVLAENKNLFGMSVDPNDAVKCQTEVQYANLPYPIAARSKAVDVAADTKQALNSNVLFSEQAVVSKPVFSSKLLCCGSRRYGTG